MFMNKKKLCTQAVLAHSLFNCAHNELNEYAS